MLHCLFLAGVLHVMLWKAAPCHWGGSNTQPNCKAGKEEGNFLRDPVGSERSWHFSRCHWKLLDWAGIFSSVLKKLCSRLAIFGFSRVSRVAMHLERVFAFHLGVRYRKGVVSISDAQGHKSKCLPCRISPQSSLKWQAVFHEHVSLEYSDCSKMQNCDYGEERNIQTKCYSILRQSPELSMICSVPRMWYLLYMACAVPQRLYMALFLFPIFLFFSV